MSNNYDKISDAMDAVPVDDIGYLPPSPVKKQSIAGVAAKTPDAQDAVDDYDYAKRNLENLLDKGGQVLEGLIQICRTEQRSRDFEAASMLIKNMSDVSKDLLNLRKSYNDIQKSDAESNKEKNVPKEHHSHIHCTTADLAEIMKTIENKEEDASK